MLYLVQECQSDPGFEGPIWTPTEAARISQLLVQLKIKRLYIAPQRAALETVQGFLRCAETAERGIQILVDYSLGSSRAQSRPLRDYEQFGITRTQQIQGNAPSRQARAGTDEHAIHLWQWWSYVSRDIMDNPVPSAVVASADTVLSLQQIVDPLTPTQALPSAPGRVIEYGPAMLGWQYRRTM
jgi:hypothetical protein